MRPRPLFVALAAWCLLASPPTGRAQTAAIPRPEHPRPDAVRAHWQNLNGAWDFRFDPEDEGVASKWFEAGANGFDRKIAVPFGWESELSGIKADRNAPKVGWYRREIRIPGDFPKSDRVLLRFEAVDWRADVWVNGKSVASHEGGYSPFEADITDAVDRSRPATVVVRAFDPTDPELPTGKQVGWYTPTSGIWQTVWLESRPKDRVGDWTVTTEIAPAVATFRVKTDGNARSIRVQPANKAIPAVTANVNERSESVIKLPVPDPKLWTPDSPHLYDVAIEALDAEGKVGDSVQTYFGLRTIARGTYGSAPYERILLNGKPLYLRAALDQSFNPKGIYTAPDDDFLKNDLMFAKFMGLNALRIHIKPDEPRRLYWADRLGLLILEDMPNTWRQSQRARTAWEKTMREVVARDRNHPAIVAWIAFNETWGLGSPEQFKANKDTQAWVKSMVAEIRKLDPTRLVEDHSPCNYDHVAGSDLNSWHFYIDEHAEAKRHIQEVVDRTKPGSTFNYCPGEVQGTAPLINSEYGGVSAGSGDRDISWSFRDLTTQLRKQGKIQGYVYTELTDIEWEHNGFANYDRTPKAMGYDEVLRQMLPYDLQQDDFIGYDAPPAIVASPGETITVPIFISHYSERKGPPVIRYWLEGETDKGDHLMVATPSNRTGTWEPYSVTTQEPIRVEVPDRPFVGALLLTLRDDNNQRYAANFVNVVVKPEKALPRVANHLKNQAIVRFSPGEYSRSVWSGSPSTPPPGKVYGRGTGFIEYKLKLPKAILDAEPARFELMFEAGARADREKVDWPERRNPQDYPQTDGKKFPTQVEIALNGVVVQKEELEDDAADARGVLSHLNGVEHGSHGEIVSVIAVLPESVRKELAAGTPLTIRFEVPASARWKGGLTIFGADTGRYPMDPTLILHTRKPLPDPLSDAGDRTLAVETEVSRREMVIASGAEWSFKEGDVPPEWAATGFDAGGWAKGKSGFGSRGTPGVRIRTPWESGRIQLRKEFDLGDLDPRDRLILRVYHDEDVRVSVNGATIFEAGGYATDYLEIPLTEAQKSRFRSGKNVMAVSCRQSTGGQGVDLELIRIRKGP